MGGCFAYLGNEYISLEQVDFYEAYLGPIEDQRHAQSAEAPTHPDVPKRGLGFSSTIVCNHIGFFEIMNFIASPMHPSFTPKADVAKIPVASAIADALQYMYVERGGSESARNRIVQ